MFIVCTFISYYPVISVLTTVEHSAAIL